MSKACAKLTASFLSNPAFLEKFNAGVAAIFAGAAVDVPDS